MIERKYVLVYHLLKDNADYLLLVNPLGFTTYLCSCRLQGGLNFLIGVQGDLISKLNIKRGNCQ